MKQQKHIRFDWAIKRLLRQKANFVILEGFLSELLKEDIKIIEILDSESNKETEEDKHNRLDILVKDNKGDLIIIEIQNSYALDYFLRILYGISKTLIEHIKSGASYSNVKKIISINIVYFDLGQGSDYLYKGTTSFRGMHDNQLLELTPTQKKLFKKEKIEDIYPEIYLIKVNNFDDNAKDTLDEWIYFLKNSEIKKEFSAKGLQEANEVLKVANMSDEDRREYKRYEEVLSDRASIAETIEFESELKAEEKAKILAEEKAKILAEEKAKTLAEEKAKILAEEKISNEKREIVINLLQIGNLSDNQIATIARVPLELVKKISEGLQ